MGEIKRHPYTSVSALACLLACVVGGPFILSTKADASDVRALSQQIAQVRGDQKRDFTEGELRQVNSELFQITYRISELERAGQPVELMLYKRRDDLLGQQRRLEAQLRDMDAKQ